MTETERSAERLAKVAIDGVMGVVERVLPEAVGGVIDRTALLTLQNLFNDPRYPFLVGGQLYMMERGMDPWRAWVTMRDETAAFLKDERRKFGAPGYSWDAAAGRELAIEFMRDG